MKDILHTVLERGIIFIWMGGLFPTGTMKFKGGRRGKGEGREGALNMTLKKNRPFFSVAQRRMPQVPQGTRWLSAM